MDKWIYEPSSYQTVCYNCKHHQYTKIEKVMRLVDAGIICPSNTMSTFIKYPNDASCAINGDFKLAVDCMDFERTDGWNHWIVHKKYRKNSNI